MSRGQRLAAFQSPSASPNRKNKADKLENQSTEATAQRRARTLIAEFRGCWDGWEELVRASGTKALKGLLDGRTELELRIEFNKGGTADIVQEHDWQG
jgi:hypothetical protein